MTKPLYILKNDGQGSGGFLAPPGHPSHFYSVEGYWGGRIKPVNGPDLIAGIGFLIKNEYGDVPAELKARAQQIMDSAVLVYSEKWIRNVYGYFRNSYSSDGTDRNVSHAISSGKLHCHCGQEFWNRKGLDYHLDKSGIGQSDHYEVAVPLPPAEHHLGYLMVREYFPEHTPRLDLIKDPGSDYGSHKCPKCGKNVQYEARKDAFCEVFTSPWRWIPDCPSGGQHE